MEPFREALTCLGFHDVVSVGMSGNLIFTADRVDRAVLERRIGGLFETTALVRTRAQLARIAREDPLSSSVLFLERAPSPARRRAFGELDFEPPRPVLRGATVYFAYPARARGVRSPFDFEQALERCGTARSARVVSQILARL